MLKNYQGFTKVKLRMASYSFSFEFWNAIYENVLIAWANYSSINLE